MGNGKGPSFHDPPLLWHTLLNGNATPRKVNDFSNHDDSWLINRMTDVLAIQMGSRSAVSLTVALAAYLGVNIKVVGNRAELIGIIWSLEPDAARLAAEIQRTQMSKGRPVSVRDLFIAASALVNGCNVVITRNVRDFEAIDGLRVETY